MGDCSSVRSNVVAADSAFDRASSNVVAGSGNLSRRQLIARAGAAALLLDQSGLRAQPPPGRTVVFAHTTVVTVDAVQDDVALAVQGDKIVAIRATDTVLMTYPNADVYDGRGKALLPGLINCHAHMAAVL